MKRIRKLNGPPPLLRAYLDHAGGQVSWEHFRGNSGRHRELLDTLTDSQHGLCGYCEIDGLRKNAWQVEHVIPRNDRKHGAARELDYTNLIVCCLGGTKLSDDAEEFLAPVPDNMSCGQAKGDKVDAAFIDPRTLPALQSLTRVYFDGRIKADTDACKAHGIGTSRVEKTIEILGLNVARLRVSREKRWQALNMNLETHFADSQVMRAAARGELLPNSSGGLPKFFTTNRSYFAPLSEDILGRHPQAWI